MRYSSREKEVFQGRLGVDTVPKEKRSVLCSPASNCSRLPLVFRRTSDERQTENGDERIHAAGGRREIRKSICRVRVTRIPCILHKISRFSKLDLVSRICLSISCPGQVSYVIRTSTRKPENPLEETRQDRVFGWIFNGKHRFFIVNWWCELTMNLWKYFIDLFGFDLILVWFWEGRWIIF